MFLKDRKVKKFAKTVEERQNAIFVFGSSHLTQEFIQDLIELGLENNIALIADDEKAWVEEVEEKITVLIENRLDKYEDKSLYDLIGFSTAQKIIILHENSQLVQNIISNIDNISQSDLSIILVSQFAPPFVKYLSQAQRDKFIITDNVHSITADLYNTMGLNLEQPPIITVPIPKKLIGKVAKEIDLKKSSILRIERTKGDEEKLIPPDNVLQNKDRIMLYLFEGEESIKEVITYFDVLKESFEEVKASKKIDNED